MAALVNGSAVVLVGSSGDVFVSEEWIQPHAGEVILSDQLILFLSGRRVKPNQRRGKLRIIHWDFQVLPVSSVGAVLVCGKMRKGERVFGGRETHSALSSGGAAATGSYGTYAYDPDGISLGAVDDIDRFLVATSLEAAGGNNLADTIAHFLNWEATADFFVCLTNSVEAFATAGRVTGYLLVVND